MLKIEHDQDLEEWVTCRQTEVRREGIPGVRTVLGKGGEEGVGVEYVKDRDETFLIE